MNTEYRQAYLCEMSKNGFCAWYQSIFDCLKIVGSNLTSAWDDETYSEM